MQTYSLGVRRHPLVHIVGSTNFFVGTVNTLVAGALAALIAATMGAPIAVVVIAGVLAASPTWPCSCMPDTAPSEPASGWSGGR